MNLQLLRHSTAETADDEPSDHARPLTREGRREATALGRWLAGRKVQPALVYGSSARRAVETLELVLAELHEPPSPQLSRDLYLASARRLFEVVHESPDEATSILLVGHNPGIGELALRLIGRGDPQERARIRVRFPPATFVEIGLPGESWDAVELGAGELLAARIPERQG